MKYEIGFEKNGVCQARIIDGPSAEICTAYFAEIEPRATIFGASPADGVKPGQPCTTVPADWTPASVAAPAAPAEAPAEAPDRRQQIRDDYAGIVAQYLNAGSDYNGARLFAMRDTAAQWDLDPATFPGYAELVNQCYPDPDAPAEAAEKLVPLDPEKARPRQRIFRVVDNAGHTHDFCTAAAALHLAATAADARFLQRASNRRGTWLPITHTGLQAAAAAEAARATAKKPSAAPAAPAAAGQETYLSVFESAGFTGTMLVKGKDMDAVNAYIVKWFDVNPGEPFRVVTNAIPAELAEAMRAAGTAYATTRHKPSIDATHAIARAAGAIISEENTKLGKVSNMSLAPGKSCSDNARRTCLIDGCYACKSYRLYPETRAAWDANTDAVCTRLQSFEYGMKIYFHILRPRFFRIHVGGDFISKEYAETWARIAESAPGTKFLAFTKQWDNVRGVSFPDNFTLRLSDWPGTTVPADLRQLFHVAWCDDCTRPADTFPADALECPGNCETCGACWDIDRDTIFHKH